MWKIKESNVPGGSKVWAVCSGGPGYEHPPVEKVLYRGNITSGKSTSCGCARSHARMVASDEKDKGYIGSNFGRWKVLAIHRAPDIGRPGAISLKYADVECCGGLDTPHPPVKGQVPLTNLTLNRSTSCGCQASENTSARNLEHGLSIRGSLHPLFLVWNAIRERTTNPGDRQFHSYGGRGITLAPEFHSAPVFIAYVESLPGYENRRADKLQLDRIDNEKGYERGNLRWATPTVNARNTRKAVWVIDSRTGEKVFMGDEARKAGVDRSQVFHYRRKHGIDSYAETLNRVLRVSFYRDIIE